MDRLMEILNTQINIGAPNGYAEVVSKDQLAAAILRWVEETAEAERQTIYGWLGVYRDEMSPESVLSLQVILDQQQRRRLGDGEGEIKQGGQIND